MTLFHIRNRSTAFKIFLLQAVAERNLERAAWQDLAAIYSKLASWADAEICLNKAKSLDFHCPRGWHTTGGTIF